MSRHRSLAITLVLILSAAWMSACADSPLEPQVVATTVRDVVLTGEQWAVWPRTPSLSGGTRIVIRGTADGCSMLAASAARRGLSVSVAISVEPPPGPCLAVVGFRAYEVELLGLPSGQYDVYVRETGHTDSELRARVHVSTR